MNAEMRRKEIIEKLQRDDFDVNEICYLVSHLHILIGNEKREKGE
jgi:hypothetical protein